jgi:hypothetical protein
MSGRNRSWKVVLLFVVAVAGAVVLGVLTFGSQPSSVSSQHPPELEEKPRSVWRLLNLRGHRLPPGRHVSSTYFQERIPLINGPQKPMPPRLAAQVSKTLGSPERLFEKSVYVPTTLGGLWVGATATVVCLVEAVSGSVTCSTPPRVAIKGLALGIARPVKEDLEYRLQGIAPAGVTSVEVKVGHRVRRLPVRKMTYAIRAQRRIVVIDLLRRGSS